MEKPIKQLFRDFIEDRCTPAEIEQVSDLLRQNVYEQEWLQAMEEAESGADQTAGAELPFHTARLFKRVQKSAGIKGPQKSYAWLAYAAVLLALLSAGLLFLKYSGQPRPVLSAENRQHGKEPALHKWIKLPDGTSVQLNAHSHLSYPQSFAGMKTREVTLTGEAYFDVRHNSARPFIIHTGKIRTTVLGTAFNISAYQASRGVTVTVTRGKVIVQDERRTLGILTPDQQLIWNNDHPVLKSKVNAASVISWKKSDLIMDDMTLAEAALLITRNYGLEVRFSNDKVKECRFTAAFLNRNTIDQVLKVLGDITGARLTLKDHTITIDGQGCPH